MQAAIPNGNGQPPVSAPCVLVVDDDPSVRLLCAVNLRLDGCDVIEASNGEEALEHALEFEPDLVVIDVTMPVLDGFGLAAALRANERTRGLPFVFLTGELDPAVRARAFAAGALGFFAKPFDPAVIGVFVKRLLGEPTTGEDGPPLSRARDLVEQQQ